MRRTTHYSRSPRTRRLDAAGGPAPEPAAAGPGVAGPETGGTASTLASSAASSAATTASATHAARRTLRERMRALPGGGWPALLGAAALAALLAVGLATALRPATRSPTQADIDAAVQYSLENRPPAPSAAAQAYDVIRPSVVLVRRLREGTGGAGKAERGGRGGEADPAAGRKGEDAPRADGGGGGGSGSGSGSDRDGKGAGSGERRGGAQADATDEAGKPVLTGVGTGVVFSEDGLIFTNLHVITGKDDIGVVFADGTESEVEVVDAQPENDLAVLKAKTLPDDLRPATLRSTRGLRTGDEVLAVGFPFGIGPTATWGVVSGLRREHYSEQGRRNLVDLIQFDAAANPGNSGGPLVTRDGDVVGIVTAIVNPTDEGFFVGIGFAVPIENAAAAAGISPF
jgi:S1-C subfamily serine protease